MEYYKAKIRFKDSEYVGIAWNPKYQRVWVGGFTRISKHVTAITFKFFNIEEKDLLPKSGVRQKNRIRYYFEYTDLGFRQALLKLGLRYAITPCQSGIKDFT